MYTVRSCRPGALVAAVVVPILLASVVTACGSGETGPRLATGTVDVTATDNQFDAPTVTVPAGTTVHFVNQGHQVHDIVPVAGGPWGISRDGFGPGGSYAYRFVTAGTYPYFCTIHGTKNGKGMAGTIVVTA